MKDVESTMKPPFRADHVGSLLRPKAISDARAAGKTGAPVVASVYPEWIAERMLSSAVRLAFDLCLQLGEQRAVWLAAQLSEH